MSEYELSGIRKAAAWGGVGLGMSIAATVGVANHVSEETTVGAHEGIVTLTRDGHATAEDIPVVGGDIRIPIQTPLGTGVNFKITHTPDVISALQTDALIAAQPRGEKEKVKDTANKLVLQSILGGAALGTLTVGGIYTRRRYGRTVVGETGIVMATAGSLITVGLMAIPGTYLQQPHANWTSLEQQVPILKQIDDPLVSQVEINNNDLGKTAVSLINSGVVGYQDSINFYGPLKDQVAIVASQLRQPEPGEQVAVIISDRHDNTNIDPVIRAVGDAVGATIVLDSGDDFGASQSWEAFSTNSLGTTFKHYDQRFVSPGNHDWAPFTKDAYDKAKFTVLDGSTKELEGGMTIIGDRDPRRSGLADLPEVPGEETPAELGQRLGAIACEEGNVSIAMVHSPLAAQIIAETGCVDLALAGHSHIIKGPETVHGVQGDTTLFVNGTSGGASGLIPIALRNKLQTDATMALVTLRNGRPVGIQTEVFTKRGEIIIGTYRPINLGPLSLTGIQSRRNILLDKQ